MTQSEKAKLFFNLHHQGNPFVMANPWDVGSAHIMAAKGFAALGTTSVGVDHMMGQKAATAGRDTIMENARQIVAATDLPVSIDLEDCYGVDAQGIAETIQLAADTGAVGGSIEDAIYSKPGEIYPLEQAVERVRAAVEAASALPFKFTLCARCENFLLDKLDMDDTIARLRAYAEAGADLLYAPGLSKPEQIEQVVQAVDKPINVLLGISGHNLTMADMHRLGVARVSIGSGFHRAAISAAIKAMDEVLNKGTFDFTKSGVPMGTIDEMMGD